ncbi:restriction endonuclease subunit S [Chishuiella changwenlii]|uniref:restriction endonuclease subunit S n=1 Tax=Chishuiella changwenlii TaxID=1434701 RepID=UPI002FDA94D9
MGYKKLSELVNLVDIKNTDCKVTRVIGVSITKNFIPSVANLNGVDLTKYNLIKKNQFACKLMSVGRDLQLPIDLYKEDDLALISSAYYVFEVKDENDILPDYLNMWFRRKETDRWVGYISGGDVRGGISWDMFLEMDVNVLSIEKQSEIVAQYQTVGNKIKVNEQICEKMEATAQALYKQWFVDFEFPNDDGLPYKSSGGTMVFNEELEKEVIEGWEVGTIGDLFTFQRGHDLPSQDRIYGEYPIFASTGIAEYHNEFKIDKPTIITGRSGSLGELFYYDQPCWPLNTSLYIIDFKKALPFYSLYFLQTINLKELGAGSAVPTLNRNDIHMLVKEIPSYSIIELFESKIILINNQKDNYIKQNQKLTQLQSLLLSRLVRLEEN